jgi:hypothetical protein
LADAGRCEDRDCPAEAEQADSDVAPEAELVQQAEGARGGLVQRGGRFGAGPDSGTRRGVQLDSHGNLSLRRY